VISGGRPAGAAFGEKVVVCGGGPGRLETAMYLAQTGKRSEILEMADNAGGGRRPAQ
jgi:phytoene dehydrogenase-like protein